MKIWMSDEARARGGRKYFAVVEEVMVDKTGKPVYSQAKSAGDLVQTVNYKDERVDELEKKVEYIMSVLNDKKAAPSAVIPVVDDSARSATSETVKSSEIEKITETEKITEINRINETNKTTEAQEVEKAKEETPEAIETTSAETVSDKDALKTSEATVIAATVSENNEENEVQTAPEAEIEVAATEAAAAIAEEEKPAYVRSRSFAEKMRDASEILQDRYDELKNYALRFRKLKSRISRKFDSINQGRFQFVKLSIAGKTLKLYLNMDIKTTDPKFHCKDMSDKKTYVTVPVLLRIKSGRAVKYAKRLIDQCAEQHEMLERRKPFVVDAMDLIEQSLSVGAENDATDVDTNVGEE